MDERTRMKRQCFVLRETLKKLTDDKANRYVQKLGVLVDERIAKRERAGVEKKINEDLACLFLYNNFYRLMLLEKKQKRERHVIMNTLLFASKNVYMCLETNCTIHGMYMKSISVSVRIVFKEKCGALSVDIYKNQ